MSVKIRKEDALVYHSKGRPGKIEVIPTKETKSQSATSLWRENGCFYALRESLGVPIFTYKSMTLTNS